MLAAMRLCFKKLCSSSICCSKTSAASVQGVLAFRMRVLPPGLSTTSRVFAAGPLTVWYHAPLAHLEAILNGTSIRVSFAPGATWQTIAVAWEAGRPCLLDGTSLDGPRWRCAIDDDVAQGTLWRSRNLSDKSSSEMVIGGKQANRIGLGLAADVDSVHVFAANTSIATALALEEVLSASAYEQLPVSPDVDECGNALLDAPLLPWSEVAQAANDTLVLKVSFDSVLGGVAAADGGPSNVTAHHISFVLSGARTDQTILLNQDSQQLYVLPVVAAAEVEEIVVQHTCGSALQVTPAPASGPDAIAASRSGRTVMREGRAVMLRGWWGRTCELEISQGAAPSAKRTVRIVSNLSGWLWAYASTTAVSAGLGTPGSVAIDISLWQHSAHVVIAAEPDVGFLAQTKMPAAHDLLRVGDRLRLSSGSNSRTIYWHRPDMLETGQVDTSFEYAVEDMCSQSNIQRVTINSPPQSSFSESHTVLGPAGLALCFDGGHTVQLAGLNLTLDACKPSSLPLVGSFGISLWFKTTQTAGGTLARIGPFELALDPLTGVRWSVNGTRTKVHDRGVAWASGSWHRVVATWDASDTRLTLRVNQQAPRSTLLRWQDSNRVRSRAAGQVSGSIGEDFVGCLDELAVITTCQRSTDPSGIEHVMSADLGSQIYAEGASPASFAAGACSGPLYLRFNDDAVNVTNTWAADNSTLAQLLSDGEPAFEPLQSVSTVLAAPWPPSQNIAPGESFVIDYEASRLGDQVPEARFELSGPSGSGVGILLQVPGSPPQAIVSFDRVALPAGGSLLVSTSASDRGDFAITLTPHPVQGRSADRVPYQFTVQHKDPALECTPAGVQRVLPTTPGPTLDIPWPRCVDGVASGALDMHITALPSEGFITIGALAGPVQVVERTPHSISGSQQSLTFWKPVNPSVTEVSVAFSAIDADGVWVDVLLLIIPLDNPAASAQPEQILLEFPDPGANTAFPALKQLVDNKAAALCRTHTHLPGIALQFRTTAALTHDMQLAQTTLYSLTLTKLSQLTVSMFNFTVLSVPAHGCNDGGWHSAAFSVVNGLAQLSFDGSPPSTWQLSANQFNSSIAAMLSSEAPVVLGNTTLGAPDHLFRGAMRDVYITVRSDETLRFPLTREAAASARAADSRRLSSLQSDGHVDIVTDEDTSIEVHLVRTPAEGELAQVWVTALPQMGWLGAAPDGSDAFAAFLTPYVQLAGSRVVYEPLPDACSSTAAGDSFEVVQVPAGTQPPVTTAAELQRLRLRSERVRVYVNCVDDAPRLRTSRLETRASLNEAHHISLADAVADADGDVIWELTAPPAHGHLYLETVVSTDAGSARGWERLDKRMELPRGVAPQLTFEPLLNTFGSPYATFSFIVRDQHTVLPEVEVRVHVEDGLAIEQAAAGPLVAAPTEHWGQITLDTWFRWTSVPAAADKAACRLVLALGSGDLCEAMGAAAQVAQHPPPIVAGRWHRAVVVHGPKRTAIAIDGREYVTLRWDTASAVDLGVADIESHNGGALAFSTISAYDTASTAGAVNRQLLHRLDFHTTSDAFTLDTVSGAIFTLHNANRSQLHVPLPRHTSPSSPAQQLPAKTLADAAFPAGHALRFNGAMSLKVPAPLASGAFRFEVSFSTGQATGQTVALAHIGGALVLGWAKGVGLSVIAPSLAYSLPTQKNYNDGSWHRAQVTVQWIPAGNLERPRPGHEGQLRVVLRIDSTTTVGFMPHIALNDTIMLGAAPGFGGYSNLLDDVTVSLPPPGAPRSRAAFAPVLQLDLDEGAGDATADATSGRSYQISGTAASVPRNTHWVPSNAPRPSSTLELVANSTTAVMLGVDADGDNVTAVIHAVEDLPDAAHAALLLPRCVSPVVDSCRVRPHHLPLHIPQAAATLAIEGSFVNARSPVRLLWYTLTDGMTETGPHRLVARAAPQTNQPPIMSSHARVEAVSAFSPRDVPSHVLNLADLAVDPEGDDINYFVSHASGAWLHAYDASSPSKMGKPLQSGAGGGWLEPEALDVKGRRLLAWSVGTAEAVVLVPAATSTVVHVHVIACDEALACSEVALPVPLRRVRRTLLLVQAPDLC